MKVFALLDIALGTFVVYRFVRDFLTATRAKPQEDESPKKPIRVWMDGCFDMFHFGHANALRQAKALGDVLVVGICSDEEILAHKGPPVMKEDERVAQVRACKWVDEVVTGMPYEVDQDYLDMLLNKYNIDYVVHGDDECLTADGRDAYEAVKKAGRFKTIKRTEGVSTTDIVGRMLLLTKSHHMPSDKGDGSSLDAHHPIAKGDDIARISHFLPTTRRINQFSPGKAPEPSDVIVYVDGAWDMFHVGHISILEKAKALGTFLLVGIHDDDTVNKYQGSNHPIMNLHERTLSILSCKFVDEVIIGAPECITRDMIVTMNIKVVAEGFCGEERLHANGSDPYQVAKDMGMYTKVTGDFTMTIDDILERILHHKQEFEKKFNKKSAKEKEYLETKSYVPET